MNDQTNDCMPNAIAFTPFIDGYGTHKCFPTQQKYVLITKKHAFIILTPLNPTLI